MAYKDDFKRKILIEDQKKQDNTKKLDRIQSEFIKFDKGIINSKKLINTLNNDLGLKVSKKLEQMLVNPSFDNKNFGSVLKNLEILKDDNTEYRQASAKLRNYSYNKHEDIELRKKLKKSHIIPEEVETQNEKNRDVKDACQSFINSEVSRDEFKNNLQRKGVNVNNAHITQAISKVERGDKEAFRTLYGTISLYKEDNPKEVKMKTMPKNWIAMDNEIPQTNFSKKRFIHNHPAHSLASKNEVFDWKGNIVNEIKREMLATKGESENTLQKKRRNISHVFDNYKQEEIEKPKPPKKIFNDNYKSTVFSNDTSKNEPNSLLKGKKIYDLKNSSIEIKSTTIFSGSNKGKLEPSAKHKKGTYKNFASSDNPLGYSTSNKLNKGNNESNRNGVNKSCYDFNNNGNSVMYNKYNNRTITYNDEGFGKRVINNNLVHRNNGTEKNGKMEISRIKNLKNHNNGGDSNRAKKSELGFSAFKY